MSMADVKLPDPELRAASGTLNVRILRSSANSQAARDDRVAVEAPLEFLLHHPALGPEPMSFGTTMRTPGDDESLAAGLLYGEGIVNRAADIEAIESRCPSTVSKVGRIWLHGLYWASPAVGRRMRLIFGWRTQCQNNKCMDIVLRLISLF